MRPASEQRRLLAETIRQTAGWRKTQIERYPDDDAAVKASRRSALALRALANFVDGLTDDDPALALPALGRVDARGGTLVLCPDALTLLGRFGLGRGAWQAGTPTEGQMRNLLNRLDGIEAAERAGRKRRAEAGYGDD